jgi:hypothetical protein
MAVGNYFPPRKRFASRNKIAAARHPSLRFVPAGASGLCPCLSPAIEAAMGAEARKME